MTPYFFQIALCFKILINSTITQAQSTTRIVPPETTLFIPEGLAALHKNVGTNFYVATDASQRILKNQFN